MATIKAKNGVYTFTASGDVVDSAESNKNIVALVISSVDITTTLSIRRKDASGDLLWSYTIVADPTSVPWEANHVVRFNTSGGLHFGTTGGGVATIHLYTGPGA